MFRGKVLECATMHYKKCFPSCERQIHVWNGFPISLDYPGIHIKLIRSGENKQQTKTSLKAALIWLCLKTSHLHVSSCILVLSHNFSVLFLLRRISCPALQGDGRGGTTGCIHSRGSLASEDMQFSRHSAMTCWFRVRFGIFRAVGFAGSLPVRWPLCRPPGYKSYAPHPHWGGPGQAQDWLTGRDFGLVHYPSTLTFLF